MKNKFSVIILVLFCFTVSASAASAHVVVRPSEVGVAERLNFTVSVPTEKDTPTVGVRLLVPEGLKSVRPNAKAGWNIQLSKSEVDGEQIVTEIIWTAGNIPPDQRDEFVFSAQAPASETTLTWKAYQTYKSGEVVSWDRDPNEIKELADHPTGTEVDDADELHPFSQTKVVNDIKSSPTSGSSYQAESTQTDRSFVLSILAIFLSLLSIGMQLRRNH